MKAKTTSLAMCLFSVLCFSSAAFAQNHEGDGRSEEQIEGLIEQARQGTLKCDPSYVEKNATEDYTRVEADGKLVSKTEWMNSIRKCDTKFLTIQFGNVKVRIYGNVAVATHTAYVKGTNKGQDSSGHFQITRVFVKQGGTWQEVAFQGTRISQ